MPLPRVKNALLIMAVKGAHEARYGRGKDAERDSDAFPWDNPEKSISLERFGLWWAHSLPSALTGMVDYSCPRRSKRRISPCGTIARSPLFSSRETKRTG